jgi:hypothetical protein
VDAKQALFIAATETTFEKWYVLAVPGRMHVDDLRDHPDSMVESPWRELMLPHQQRRR